MSGEREHQQLLREAIEREGEARGLLLKGKGQAAHAALGEVAELYRRSWEAAPPRSYGRLIGMLKAAVLRGDAEGAATYVREAVGPDGDSPTSWYALALAALIEGDDSLAASAAAGMREEGGRGRSTSDAFRRTADAVAALAERDRDRYARALEAIIADFEAREQHLTGVAIADTALVLERLAQQRGIQARSRSTLLPPC
jgi:hypothetical protein